VSVELSGAVVVVTGGASGIGRALALRLADEGASAVIVADLDHDGAARVAVEIGSAGVGIGVDVAIESDLAGLVDRVEREYGPIDVWCSNAGIGRGDGLGHDEDWERSFRIHVMAHVFAARCVLPGMASRGRGHFLITASAAGLLIQMDSAPYSVTKHGSVALAEWLAIRYGGTGVGFSCLCPQGVRTPMMAAAGPESATLAAGGMIEPEQVAEAVVGAIRDGHFLVLPHPEVADYERRRAADRDRWLVGMRRVAAKLGIAESG